MVVAAEAEAEEMWKRWRWRGRRAEPNSRRDAAALFTDVIEGVVIADYQQF